MANSIPEHQNAEPQLKFLRARQQLYASATTFLVLQLFLTLLVPLAGAILAAFRPDAKPYRCCSRSNGIAARHTRVRSATKTLLKRAAKIAEQFNCAVLELPWNEFTVGERVETEEIHSAAKVYAKRHDDKLLRDWYPPEVGTIPLSMARIICQRTNLHYDRRLRVSYGNVILTGASCVVLAIWIYGLANNLSITAWVLTMAPAIPVLAWAGREFYRQRDSAEPLEKLLREARKFWNEALSNGCEESYCLMKSREFQDAIYSRRIGSPLIFPLVYRLRRSSLEDEMHEGATDFLRQYAQSKLPPWS